MVRVCVCVGTGMQIPPAAQQALQMSGAIAIGAMAAVSGTRLSIRQGSPQCLNRCLTLAAMASLPAIYLQQNI